VPCAAAALAHAALLDGRGDGGEVRGHHRGVSSPVLTQRVRGSGLADPLLLVFQHDLLDRVKDGDPAEVVATQELEDILPVASNAASSIAEYASPSIRSR